MQIKASFQMNGKNFVLDMVELIDHHVSRRKGKAGDGAKPDHLRCFLRWIMPNGGLVLSGTESYARRGELKRLQGIQHSTQARIKE